MDSVELLSVIEKAERGNVTELNLSSKSIKELPPEIGKLKNLTVLYLRNNQLTSLPHEIGELKNLTVLWLNNNKLTSLPHEIGELKKLTELWLSGNKLISLPHEIGELKNLTWLDLDDNQLTSLPHEIVELKNLTTLYLSNNQLTSLPHEIVELKNLTVLDLDGNNITDPPPEIIKQGIEAIRNYFMAKQKGASEKLYEAKLLIVGQGEVGKTCLMNRLIYKTYEEQTQTEGISIKGWKVNAPDGSDTQITLNVWDFGGQEIYHATHQFFLTGRSVYLLVWDTRKEEEYGRLDHWLRKIEAFGSDSPIILVHNKWEITPKEISYQLYKDKYPQLKGYFRVSCKSPDKGWDTFEKLIKFISEMAWELPQMGNKWIDSWFKVREELEASSKNLLDYSEYLKKCAANKIEENEARILSQYLHDLGVVLHFKDIPTLRTTIILKPEWATEAVYKVAGSKKILARGGILKPTDLIELWTSEGGYPTETHNILLGLMDGFELIFKMIDSNDYIVASLLSPNPVKYSWDNNDNLKFNYTYSFLPSSIMPRLIVRLHVSIERHDEKYQCWSNGVIFSWGSARARVLAFPDEKRIEISVWGYKGNELLAIIRQALEGINLSIKKAVPKRTIPCICKVGCPHPFDYDFLKKMEDKGKTHVPCNISAEDVDIKKLLIGIEHIETSDSRHKDLRADDFKTASPKKVFISYNHNDTDKVLSINDAINISKSGIKITIDIESMKFGDNITDFIGKSIKGTDFTLSIISNNSLLSPWVMLETLETFMYEKVNLNSKFLPVIIDKSFYKPEFYVEAVTHIEKAIVTLNKQQTQIRKKYLPTTDLNNQIERHITLRNNLDKVLSKLREHLSADFTTTKKINENLPALINHIISS